MLFAAGGLCWCSSVGVFFQTSEQLKPERVGCANDCLDELSLTRCVGFIVDTRLRRSGANIEPHKTCLSLDVCVCVLASTMAPHPARPGFLNPSHIAIDPDKYITVVLASFRGGLETA